MVNEVTRYEVEALVGRGAQIVDVLEAKEYEDSHLPGAVHIPLAEIAEKASRLLDPAKPTITYCYDSLCDMSPRAARRLESVGFADVYDYVASKVDWLGAGLPFEGTRAEEPHLAGLADTAVATCAITDTTTDVRNRIADAPLCVVMDAQRVVLGLVRAEALALEDRPIADVMQEAPRTFRPHVSAAEMARQLDKAPQPWLLVTNLNGTLVGIADPDQVRRAVPDAHKQSA
ncbi:MAG: rhodanese-like domain-containing protein [Acidimicrobiia bacterium]